MTAFSRRMIEVFALSAVLFTAHVGAPGRCATAEPGQSAAVRSARPPAPPAHKKRYITNAADLAADLHDVVVYLAQGQAYFREYHAGTHSVAENADFLSFLETYEKELALAKKEAKTLGTWLERKGALKAESR